MSAPLVVERDGPVWTVTLARADKRNALSAELVDGLVAAVDDAHAASVQMLVLRGDGRNFSAGFDFGDVEAESEGDLLLRFVRIETLLARVWNASFVTLGLAHGRNFGAGVDLFAACRMRIAAPDATFRMPGLKFGVVLGTRRFATLVGAGQADAILGDARTFDATQAHAMRFVDQIVEPAQWGETIASARASASALDPVARSALNRATRADRNDADLASLVRSVARPGIKERIARYLAASREA